MTAASSVRTELAGAVRAVNAAYNRLPVAIQNTIDLGFDPVEAEVDAAIIASDRERALASIRAWREYWLDQITRTGR